MRTRRALLSLLSTTATAGIAGCASRILNTATDNPPVDGPCGDASSTWPTAGGNPGRTGRTDTAPPASDADIVDLLAGVRGNGRQRLASSPPAIANGVAYVPSGSGIVALDLDAPADGPIWTHDLRNDVDAMPALACGVVLVPGLNRLVALDPTTGTQYWRADVGSQGQSSIGAIGETVYATGSGPVSVAVRTGKTQWHAEGGDVLAASTEGVYTTLNVNGTGGVFAHDHDGNEMWHLSLGKIVASPSVSDGRVWVADNEGSVYSIDATTGATDWSQSLDGVTRIHSGLAVHGDDVVVPAGTGERSVILDAATGQTRWSAETGIVTGRPVIGDDWVAFGRTNAGITVYDRSTGTQQTTWSREAYDLGTVDGLVPVEGGFVIHEGTTSGLSLIQ